VRNEERELSRMDLLLRVIGRRFASAIGDGLRKTASLVRGVYLYECSIIFQPLNKED
jgi:hypothetical protein